MEALLIFLTIFAAVSSRNVPNTAYIPTKEQLELIFGCTSPKQTKPTAVDTSVLIPNESAFIGKHIRPYQKKTSYEINESETLKTVELNIKIKVNDLDKKGGSDNKTTGDGTNTVKENPEKDSPEIHSRFVEDLSSTDDRMSLEGVYCTSGKVRFGDTCVASHD